MIVTGIEAAWTALALAGLATQLWAIRDAFADRQALRMMGLANGRRRLVNGHIRSALVFCSIHTLFVVAGTFSLLQPNTPLTAQRAITIAMLMLAAVFLVANGLLDRHDRHVIRSRRADDPIPND